MRYVAILAGIGLLLAVTGTAGASAYHVKFDFEASWTADYAPGWENTAYRHGDPPVAKMMQQVSISHGGSYGMELIAGGVPQDWMWWASVNPISVSSYAMTKQFDPWMSAWYYDQGSSPTDDDPSGYLFAVPSWTNLYIDGDAGPNTEDWTDIQFGARFTAEDNYYYVACGETNPGWVDTGVARPTDTPAWHHLKMQLSSADGKVHFYIDGTEVCSSWRDDYMDLGTEIGLSTLFNDPLSGWSSPPSTIWDDFEYGSSIPEPVTMAGLMLGIGCLARYARNRRRA